MYFVSITELLLTQAFSFLDSSLHPMGVGEGVNSCVLLNCCLRLNHYMHKLPKNTRDESKEK